MAELTIWNRLKNFWQKKPGSYAQIDTALSNPQGLKEAYEKVNAMPGSGNLGELGKRTRAIGRMWEDTMVRLNSLNRGPNLGPHKRLETDLNKLKQQIEQARLKQRLHDIQEQLAVQVKELNQNAAQLSLQEHRQKQVEQQKLQQEITKLQKNMLEQQEVLANTESAMKGLQTGFVQAATALYAAAYASAGLKLDPQAMRENYVELLGRVQDLSPDMAQFIEKNDLNQPSAGNRLLLTALLEKLAPDAALDQSALANKAKGILNEFKPIAKKLDNDETNLQKEYDGAISAKEKIVDALQARESDLETGTKNLEKQIKTALIPKPGISKTQQTLENDENVASGPSAGSGLTPE